jgi:hypothetical protein
MSRDLRSTATQDVRWPTRTQDRRGVDVQVEAIVAPVAADVADQGEQLEDLERAIAEGVVVASADVELARGRRSGVAYLEGRFADNQVGAPVIVTQADAGDELEAFVQFRAAIVDRRRMRLAWLASSPAPRRVRVNYVIGIRS